MRAAAPIFAVSLLFGGCATVDMTRVGSGESSVGGGLFGSAPATESNVVEKATSRLFALFSSKGWSTLESRRKMRSAASVLLDGLDSKQLSSEPSPYVMDVASSAALGDDIREATYQVEQTAKAADIFLAMSAPEDDLREELGDLEQALLAARQAGRIFTDAAERVGTPDELARFTTKTDGLRDIVDEFGRRVRRAGTREVASLSTSAS